MKRQKWIKGAFVRIELGDGTYSIGRLLERPNVAFYNAFFKDGDEFNKRDLKVAFVTCVYQSLVQKGNWGVLEIEPLSGELLRPPTYFKHDSISGKYSLYASGRETPARKEDCVGYERLAVWEESHLIDRLKDLRAGIPNKWVESLRP